LAGGFKGGMNRLNGNLGRGQIAANEHVDVRNLAEGGFHGAEPPQLYLMGSGQPRQCLWTCGSAGDAFPYLQWVV
jgi:hypothetical protein